MDKPLSPGAPLRVIHWYPNFLGGGGVANAVASLAAAQARLGAQVWIATHRVDRPLYGPSNGSLYGAIATPGVTVAEWKGWSRLGRGRIRLHLLAPGGARALQSIEPDIVHIHGEFNPDNWWAPALWRCPLILSPHGSFHVVVRERRARGKRLYIFVARRLLYSKVSYFHALSPNEEADIEAVWPRARTYQLPQGPSPAVREAVVSRERERERGAAVRLLFVGRLDVRTKGLDILVEAFAVAVRHASLDRSVTLRLVGPDWRDGQSYLTDSVSRLGIAESVTLGPSVALADVPGLFDECDVYVQLSRHEGSPLSLNDALVLAKPAIVSDRVGTVSYEEISRLEHIVVVEPNVTAAANAIVQTVMNLDRLRAAARRTHPFVSDFLSWERAARLHLDEYATILGRGRQVRRNLGVA